MYIYIFFYQIYFISNNHIPNIQSFFQLIDEIKSPGGIKQAGPEQKNENPPKRARTGFMRKETLKLKSKISNPLIMQSPSNEHQVD